MTWANGNERSGGTPRGRCGSNYHTTAEPSCAKNPIHIGALNSDGSSMTSFSSWGPCDDGRLKPVVSAPGCESGRGPARPPSTPRSTPTTRLRRLRGTRGRTRGRRSVSCDPGLAGPGHGRPRPALPDGQGLAGATPRLRVDGRDTSTATAASKRSAVDGCAPARVLARGPAVGHDAGTTTRSNLFSTSLRHRTLKATLLGLARRSRGAPSTT